MYLILCLILLLSLILILLLFLFLSDSASAPVRFDFVFVSVSAPVCVFAPVSEVDDVSDSVPVSDAFFDPVSVRVSVFVRF